jgi:2-succinyl-6-hydroxy-2,4-cyclohexadiene-1-carboxylate synthase
VRLAADHLAAPPGHSPRGRVVLVHGFTQTRASWTTVAAELNGDGYDVVSVDAPGHGDSGDRRLDLASAAAALGETGGAATYVGYSMGGRLALHLAVAEPQLVERLVLVSTTAGIDDEAARAARRADDERLAKELERDGVAAFVDRWLTLPLFANLRSEDAQLAARLANTADGLASSLRMAGTGAQRSQWTELASLPMPVLLVVGERDTKFTAIAERMAALIADARLEVVRGAGHAVHLEQPAEFLVSLRRWLEDRPSVR